MQYCITCPERLTRWIADNQVPDEIINAQSWNRERNNHFLFFLFFTASYSIHIRPSTREFFQYKCPNMINMLFIFPQSMVIWGCRKHLVNQAKVGSLSFSLLQINWSYLVAVKGLAHHAVLKMPALSWSIKRQG